MSEDEDDLGPPRASFEPPVDVFVTVKAGGDRVTEFSVPAGEAVEIFARQDEGDA